jgi:hypothetical protein
MIKFSFMRYWTFVFACFLCIPLSFSQYESKYIGTAFNDDVLGSKVIGGYLYLAGRVEVNPNEYYGTFSKVDLTDNSLVWSTRLNQESTLIDFIELTTGEFIVVGRTEPIRIGSTWQNNKSMICKFNSDGSLIVTNMYEMDNVGGRESIAKILENPQPLNTNYPYYLVGIIDNSSAIPTSFDDVVMMNIDAGLTPLFCKRYSFDISVPNYDDEFLRSFISLNNGTGELLLAGNIGTAGATSMKLSNDGIVIGSSVKQITNLKNIQDVLFHNNSFIMVGQTSANSSFSNFILKTNNTFNVTWAYTIPGHDRIEQIHLFGSDYLISMRSGNYYTVGKLSEPTPTSLNLDWLRSLDDFDSQIGAAHAEVFGNDIIYIDRRMPTAPGSHATLGLGSRDIFLAHTDSELSACATLNVNAVLQSMTPSMTTASIEVVDYPVPTPIQSTAFQIQGSEKLACSCCFDFDIPALDPYSLSSAPFGITWGMDFQDVDNDSDFDVVIPNGIFNPIAYLENTGSSSAPVFNLTPQLLCPSCTGTGEPKGTAPRLFDIDLDGDDDLFLISADANGDFLQFFENTGSTFSNPAILLRDNQLNELPLPFNGLTSLYFDLADANGDNKADLVVGYSAELAGGASIPTFGVLYYENVSASTGTLPPVFSLVAPQAVNNTPGSQVINPLVSFGPSDIYGGVVPKFYDFDCDDDPDVWLSYPNRYGSNPTPPDPAGGLRLYENLGGTIPGNILNIVPTPQVDPYGLTGFSGANDFVHIEFVDIDNDGKVEALASQYPAAFLTFDDNCNPYGQNITLLCPSDTLNISYQPIPSGTYHASDKINSTGSVNPLQSVEFKSGDCIELYEGFNVKLGGLFEAVIEPCSSSKQSDEPLKPHSVLKLQVSSEIKN